MSPRPVRTCTRVPTTNLADVVRHHLDPQAAIERFEPSSVPLAAAEDFDRNTQDMRDFLEVSGKPIEFFRAPLQHTDAQVENLVAFLETLTDPVRARS